jgi:hypothetical protein
VDLVEQFENASPFSLARGVPPEYAPMNGGGTIDGGNRNHWFDDSTNEVLKK